MLKKIQFFFLFAFDEQLQVSALRKQTICEIISSYFFTTDLKHPQMQWPYMTKTFKSRIPVLRIITYIKCQNAWKNMDINSYAPSILGVFLSLGATVHIVVREKMQRVCL